MFATLAHHGEEAPESKRSKAQPERNPVEGEEAKEAEGGGGHKTADLGGIDGVKVEILNFGPDERAFPPGLVQTTLCKASVEPGKVDKMEIKAGLGSGGDDEKWNKS